MLPRFSFQTPNWVALSIELLFFCSRQPEQCPVRLQSVSGLCGDKRGRQRQLRRGRLPAVNYTPTAFVIVILLIVNLLCNELRHPIISLALCFCCRVQLWLCGVVSRQSQQQPSRRERLGQWLHCVLHHFHGWIHWWEKRLQLSVTDFKMLVFHPNT